MAEQTAAREDFSLGALVEETLKDHQQTQRELKEIDLLIQQSAAEVERLAQRNAQVANYVRQLQTNFETVPRDDIKEAYEALQLAQQRLFTMRGQLEKLQSDQRNLERLAEFQRRLLNTTEGLGALPDRPPQPRWRPVRRSPRHSGARSRATEPGASYARWPCFLFE